MLYKLTERGKEVYKELEQDRSRAAYNPNLAIALQAVIDVAEDEIVSETEIQKKTHMDLTTVRQLMTILLTMGLIEPVKLKEMSEETYQSIQAMHTEDIFRPKRKR